MAKSPKTKSRAAGVAVPQTEEEAAEFVALIGMRSREIARIEHAMNDEIAAAKQAAEKVAAPLTAEVQALTEGLRIFCDANRLKLTDGGRVKHHEFGTGRVEWRILPPKVSIRGVKPEDVVAWCEAQQDGQYLGFIRIKKEIDKDALLAAPLKAAAIPGVSIGSSGEQFAVAPFEAQIEGGK